LKEEIIATKAFCAVVEEGALASSSINFTHESNVDLFFFFVMIIDLQRVVSSLTLSITGDSSHCNRLMHGVGARFLNFRLTPSSSDLLQWSISSDFPYIFFYVLRTVKEYGDFY
jgi:hypothetical protein